MVKDIRSLPSKCHIDAFEPECFFESEVGEHYADTHGYTEINFAAFVMLGLCFCRVSGVQHQRIYRIGV